MANVLGELFSNIAKSIRGGLGEIEKMKPNSFPDKIDEIVSMIGASEDDVDYFLDVINGEIIGETLYHVTFRDYDGTELGVVDVYEGYDCPDPVASGIFTVEREATKYIRYIHSGWSVADDGTADSNALKAIEENRTLYAVYREEYIYLGQGIVPHRDGYEGCYIVWTLNPDYVLSVDSYGSSAVSYDHYAGGTFYPPWWGYKDEITSFVCKCANGGELGNGWLYNCTNLTNATLTITDLADNPEDYKKQNLTVGISAFRGCSSLESITLPENTLQVAHNCFQGTALKSITLPAFTKYIYEYAFYECNQLESVILTKTDGWYYARTSTNIINGNGTKVASEQAANPAFVAESLRNGYAWVRMDA